MNNQYKYQFTNDPGVVPYLNGDRKPHHFIMYTSSTSEGPCKMLLPYNVSTDNPDEYDWDEEKLAFSTEEDARNFANHLNINIIVDED